MPNSNCNHIRNSTWFYQHQNKKQNWGSSGLIILQMPSTNLVPTPHWCLVSSATGSGVYPIDCTFGVSNGSSRICSSIGIDSSIVWTIGVTDGSETTVVCLDGTVGNDIPCCSDVYPVSPVYFLIIDLS